MKNLIHRGLAAICCAAFCFATVASMPTANASAYSNAVDNIGVDRFAHFGCSYVAAETLHRAGMNRFWAGFTTLALGAAKEAWMDDHFDRRDFAADCAGALTWEIHF